MHVPTLVSQQLQYQILSRPFSPIDSVYRAPSQRVRSPSPLDRRPSTGATSVHLVPWSVYYSTTDFATRYEFCEDPCFELDYRRDRYYQQPHPSDRTEDFAPQLVSLTSVAKYLATSPSADRSREPLDDENKQLSAQLERVKALKAASAYPQQQAGPPKRFTKLPSRYLSFQDKYAAPDSAPFYYSSDVSGVLLVASAGRYTYAHARPFERAQSPGGARITERPRESRPSVVRTLAPPPSASTFNPVAAPLPVLATNSASSDGPYAAPQIAPPCSSAPAHPAPQHRETRLSAAISASTPSASAFDSVAALLPALAAFVAASQAPCAAP